ncbi:MAG: LLM class F420-dependent oxidoreductase, partial [Actinomycetota bacterium]
MLKLSAEKSLGAHPYFVPVEHTPIARAALGPDALLAPEQAVVFSTDPTTARGVARGFMSTYLGLPNYTNNLRRLGWSEEDIAGPSDRLVDAIVAWGTLDDIR